jgi:hypothetical protein
MVPPVLRATWAAREETTPDGKANIAAGSYLTKAR